VASPEVAVEEEGAKTVEVASPEVAVEGEVVPPAPQSNPNPLQTQALYASETDPPIDEGDAGTVAPTTNAWDTERGSNPYQPIGGGLSYRGGKPRKSRKGGKKKSKKRKSKKNNKK
jgi:hypothetical protein